MDRNLQSNALIPLTDKRTNITRRSVERNKSVFSELLSKWLKFSRVSIRLCFQNPKNHKANHQNFDGGKKWFIPVLDRHLHLRLWYQAATFTFRFCKTGSAIVATHSSAQRDYAPLRAGSNHIKELELPKEFPVRVLETIYFGAGGTPSLLSFEAD